MKRSYACNILLVKSKITSCSRDALGHFLKEEDGLIFGLDSKLSEMLISPGTQSFEAFPTHVIPAPSLHDKHHCLCV